MWDLIYPARCTHCQDPILRKKPFLSPFVPFFCSSCQTLVCEGWGIKQEKRALLCHDHLLLTSLFSFDSPLHSLYQDPKFSDEQAQQFLAAILVLCLEKPLFNVDTTCYMLMPDKRAFLRTKKTPYFALYQTLERSFKARVLPIYPQLNSEIRQGSSWTVGVSGRKKRVWVLLERYTYEDRIRVSQFMTWLKRQHGKEMSYQIRALFS